MEMLGRYLPWECGREHTFHVTLPPLFIKTLLTFTDIYPKDTEERKRGKVAYPLPACSKKSFSSVDLPATGISEDD